MKLLPIWTDLDGLLTGELDKQFLEIYRRQF